MKFIETKGYGITVTCRRDRFHTNIKQYIHREKNKPGDKMAKVMRYENPIVGVRQVKATKVSKAYTENIVSFQSTVPTNISGVNNRQSLQLFVTKGVRGRGGEKRVWAIEQNEAREMYLNHYFGKDVANHMIKNTANKYIT
jgi:ribosome biogenesis protein Nip4